MSSCLLLMLSFTFVFIKGTSHHWSCCSLLLRGHNCCVINYNFFMNFILRFETYMQNLYNDSNTVHQFLFMLHQQPLIVLCLDEWIFNSIMLHQQPLIKSFFKGAKGKHGKQRETNWKVSLQLGKKDWALE